ncbi:hypothetical protein CLV63_11016 [Murinocardiopsis flavida]|uniref:Uncharacterized protein n=1 Tax=Murinocardiopsis flavida TaxID=645275 RepID=A0A2P8DHQ7_9ACTN|nr:hypothetical protein CLV63_11016 [Murinocardiopsis flavida]
MRRRALFCLPLPLVLLGAAALFTGGGLAAPGWLIVVSGSVAVGTLLLALIVQPTPLPEGLSAEASVRRSLHRFRQFTSLRLWLAITALAVGFGASIAGGGLFPLLGAMVLAWPQVLLALPTFRSVTKARRAMEAWGTNAYLWAGLSQPAPVEWPIITRAAAYYRARKQRAAAAAEAPAAATAESGEQDDAAPARPAYDLPDRWAVAGTEAKLHPDGLIPGFPSSPRSARPLVRQRGPARPGPRQPRPANRRSKAKN